jgi:hypothetical protein
VENEHSRCLLGEQRLCLRIDLSPLGGVALCSALGQQGVVLRVVPVVPAATLVDAHHVRSVEVIHAVLHEAHVDLGRLVELLQLDVDAQHFVPVRCQSLDDRFKVPLRELPPAEGDLREALAPGISGL